VIASVAFSQSNANGRNPVKHYLRGLLQADSKNMERMEEVVPEGNHQALQHMLSESAWRTGCAGPSGAGSQSALGGHPIAVSSLMRAAVRRKGRNRWGSAANGVVSWARWRTASGRLRGAGPWSQCHAD